MKSRFARVLPIVAVALIGLSLLGTVLCFFSQQIFKLHIANTLETHPERFFRGRIPFVAQILTHVYGPLTERLDAFLSSGATTMPELLAHWAVPWHALCTGAAQMVIAVRFLQRARKAPVTARARRDVILLAMLLGLVGIVGSPLVNALWQRAIAGMQGTALASYTIMDLYMEPTFIKEMSDAGVLVLLLAMGVYLGRAREDEEPAGKGSLIKTLASQL